MNRQHKELEKIFANDATDNGLIYKIFKYFKYHKRNQPIKNGQKT